MNLRWHLGIAIFSMEKMENPLKKKLSPSGMESRARLKKKALLSNNYLVDLLVRPSHPVKAFRSPEK